jgi:hypothetical protein
LGKSDTLPATPEKVNLSHPSVVVSNMTTTLKILALVIMMMSFVGCATTPDTFSVLGATPEERVLIQSAMDEWCRASEGKFCANLTDESSDSSITVVDSIVNYEEDSGLCIHRGQSSEIYLSRGLSVNLFTTLLHELGHHFGLKDQDTNSAAIMFFSEGRTSEHVTMEDFSTI